MSSLTRSRQDEAKKEQEQRRTLLTLCARYIQAQGYSEASAKLIHDSGISLEKWDLADNMDLQIILKEFEEYYSIKYNKPPKLLRKVEVLEEKKANRFPKRNLQTQRKPKETATKKEENLGLEGKAINKPQETEVESHQEFYENRLLRPLPEYTGDLKELASTIYRDICQANPNVHFSDIIGLAEAKRLLKEAVLMPLKYPYLFTGLLEPWKGVLLFGPPGTGKTMLAKAVATECRTTFFNISASSIVSKWRGDSEKLVRVLFELARYYEPSTIFIDEIDSIMSQRDSGEHEGSRRMKTELLIQMDGLHKGKERIFLLAASNLPWDLDMALLRRVEKRILVPLPSVEARSDLLQTLLANSQTTEFNYEELSRRLEGYSGSDIKLICKEAAMKPIRRMMNSMEDMGENEVINWHKPIDISETPKPEPITVQDFLEALDSTRPSSTENQSTYEEWFKNFGSV